MPTSAHIMPDSGIVMTWSIETVLDYVEQHHRVRYPELLHEVEAARQYIAKLSTADTVRLRSLARDTFQPYRQQVENDLHEFSQRFYQAVRELQTGARTLPPLQEEPVPDETLQLLHNAFYQFTIDHILEIQAMSDDNEQASERIHQWLTNLPQHQLPSVIDALAHSIQRHQKTLAYINRAAAEDLFHTLARVSGQPPHANTNC